MTDSKLIIDKYGDKRWYQNGELHRTDGPAIEYASGSKSWFQNGKLHCTDGPAMHFGNGTKFWYIDGKKYSFKDWLQLCSLSYEEKCELVLIYD